MPQEHQLALMEASKTEIDAVKLIEREVALSSASEKINHPQPQLSEKEGRALARREPYGDRAVPRIRTERRYGGSSHSRAYFKQDLCLYSDRAQILFERNYEQVNQNLIICTLVVDAVGGIELADKVSQHLMTLFQNIEQELIQAIAELTRVADLRKIPADKQVPTYDHKRYYNPPLHTPQSVQFTNLMTLFDRLVARIEGCRINYIMNLPTCKQVIATWERKLLNFIRELYNIRREALIEARKAGYGARADAIQVQVRRQQSQEKLEKTDVATTGANDTPEAKAKAAEAAKEEAPKTATRTRRAPARRKAAAAPAKSETESVKQAASVSETETEQKPASDSEAPASKE